MTPIVHKNYSLKPYNTFNIDVNANFFISIDTVSALQALLADTNWKSTSKFILGGGSNILFTRDIDGLVIHNQIKGTQKINETQEHVYLKVGAGENWHQLVLFCVAHHYAGIENLSLIPGTVGAAPIQNIGAYGVELQESLYEVHAIKLANNTSVVFNNQACAFGYRDSIFKHTLKNKYIITHIVLRLNKKPIFHLEYGAIKEKLKGKPISIKSISDAIIQIRQEKLPDPKTTPNAGSFFKNPIITSALFFSLQKKISRYALF